MEELCPEYPITYEKVFYNKHIGDYEKGTKNYEYVTRSVVIRVDETKECSAIFNSLLEAVPESNITYHLVKPSDSSDTFKSNEFHIKEGSFMEEMQNNCKRLNKNCVFSSVVMKNGMEALVSYSKKVGAKNIFDLDRISKDNRSTRMLTFHRE